MCECNRLDDSEPVTHVVGSTAPQPTRLSQRCERNSFARRFTVTIAVASRPPAMTSEQYRESWARGPPVAPPAGLIVDAGIGEGAVFVTVTVCESRAAYDGSRPSLRKR